MLSSTLQPITLLCISSRFKGIDFIKEAHALGCKLYLVSDKSNQHRPWPRELLEDIFFVDESDEDWDISNLIKGITYLARTIHFDKIVALDDYDFNKVTALREHLRTPGMGQSRMRYFRDKLAMRDKAEEDDILTPEYCHVLNYNRIKAFVSIVPKPWIIKPRFIDASSTYQKLKSDQDVWDKILSLGDDQSSYLLERFITGKVYQVDSIIYNHEIQFLSVHHFTSSLMMVSQGKETLSVKTVQEDNRDFNLLLDLNTKLVNTMGLKFGISSMEFIKSDQDGQFYFLQSSNRVSGNYIAELVETSTGINLWREWAKLELCIPNETDYIIPKFNRVPAQIIRIPSSNPSQTSMLIQHENIKWRQISHNHVTIAVHATNDLELENTITEIQQLAN